jgi:hypothetical protein
MIKYFFKMSYLQKFTWFGPNLKFIIKYSIEAPNTKKNGKNLYKPNLCSPGTCLKTVLINSLVLFNIFLIYFLFLCFFFLFKVKNEPQKHGILFFSFTNFCCRKNWIICKLFKSNRYIWIYKLRIYIHIHAQQKKTHYISTQMQKLQ